MNNHRTIKKIHKEWLKNELKQLTIQQQVQLKTMKQYKEYKKLELTQELLYLPVTDMEHVLYEINKYRNVLRIMQEDSQRKKEKLLI